MAVSINSNQMDKINLVSNNNSVLHHSSLRERQELEDLDKKWEHNQVLDNLPWMEDNSRIGSSSQEVQARANKRCKTISLLNLGWMVKINRFISSNNQMLGSKTSSVASQMMATCKIR